MLTIGFGDFFPSTVATKVLLLPFAILTISQLGNQVSMIVTYFSDRDKTRRARWKSQFEAVVREEEKNRNPKATLKEEMKLVQYLAKHEQMTVSERSFFISPFCTIGAKAERNHPILYLLLCRPKYTDSPGLSRT